MGFFSNIQASPISYIKSIEHVGSGRIENLIKTEDYINIIAKVPHGEIPGYKWLSYQIPYDWLINTLKNIYNIDSYNIEEVRYNVIENFGFHNNELIWDVHFDVELKEPMERGGKSALFYLSDTLKKE